MDRQYSDAYSVVFVGENDKENDLDEHSVDCSYRKVVGLSNSNSRAAECYIILIPDHKTPEFYFKSGQALSGTLSL